MFKELIGKTVSLLITGKDSKYESYNGIIEEIKDGFIVLNCNNPNFDIDYLLIKTDIVISVWVYKDNYYPNEQSK